MVANNYAVVCPKCKQANCYAIRSLNLIDTDLHVSYLCETCETEYTDTYALVYLGGHTLTSCYDRDNITATSIVNE